MLYAAFLIPGTYETLNKAKNTYIHAPEFMKYLRQYVHSEWPRGMFAWEYVNMCICDSRDFN